MSLDRLWTPLFFFIHIAELEKAHFQFVISLEITVTNYSLIISFNCVLIKQFNLSFLSVTSQQSFYLKVPYYAKKNLTSHMFPNNNMSMNWTILYFCVLFCAACFPRRVRSSRFLPAAPKHALSASCDSVSSSCALLLLIAHFNWL